MLSGKQGNFSKCLRSRGTPAALGPAGEVRSGSGSCQLRPPPTPPSRPLRRFKGRGLRLNPSAETSVQRPPLPSPQGSSRSPARPGRPATAPSHPGAPFPDRKAFKGCGWRRGRRASPVPPAPARPAPVTARPRALRRLLQPAACTLQPHQGEPRRSRRPAEAAEPTFTFNRKCRPLSEEALEQEEMKRQERGITDKRLKLSIQHPFRIQMAPAAL